MVLNYEICNGNDDEDKVNIPEEAKCSRGRGHVLQWHGRLQGGQW